MIVIPVATLRVLPERQRQEFSADALMELANSISKHGLMHPIVVRPFPDISDGWILVAGERRLRAIQSLWETGVTEIICDSERVFEGFVPCIRLSDLDPLAAEEAEWDENDKRKDLTWQERVNSTARIDSIRRRIAARDNLPPPSLPEITQLVRPTVTPATKDAVKKELIVSKHLSDPEVAKAGTLDEAFKLLQKREVSAKNLALAQEVGKTLTGASHKIFNRNCIEWLMENPSAKFDVIVTDPPYGMNADEFGDAGGMAEGAHGYEDSPESFTKLMESFLPLLTASAKDQCHLYMFCDVDWFHHLRAQLRLLDWSVFRTPLIWHKPQAMRAPWPNLGPQRKYETILFASRGKRQVNQMVGDVITVPVDPNLGHAAQKPVALFKELLARSVRPGDHVADFFAGTGPIIPAGHSLKCYVTAIELDPTHYGIMAKRLFDLPPV